MTMISFLVINLKKTN